MLKRTNIIGYPGLVVVNETSALYIFHETIIMKHRWDLSHSSSTTTLICLN